MSPTWVLGSRVLHSYKQASLLLHSYNHEYSYNTSCDTAKAIEKWYRINWRYIIDPNSDLPWSAGSISISSSSGPRSHTRPNPPSLDGIISPSRSQLPIRSTFWRFWHVIRSLSHEAVRRAPEKVLSGSADSDGIESMSIAIRLSRGYCLRCSIRDHYLSGVQSISTGIDKDLGGDRGNFGLGSKL